VVAAVPPERATGPVLETGAGHERELRARLLVVVIASSLYGKCRRAVPIRGRRYRPQLSDLRESGAIEQDADVVMTLFREEYYKPDSEKKGIAEVNVQKNRTGPTGIVELAFLKQFTRFENLAAAPSSY
jgi:replicative DNA helicase